MTKSLFRNTKDGVIFPILLNGFFLLFSLCFIIPFIYVVSISFSSEESIQTLGYQLFPVHPTTEAYSYVFANSRSLIDAYITTTAQALLGTFLSVLVMSMCAYTLAQPRFFLKKQLTFYIFFTMIFSGGLIPSYILNTTYLHLNNNLLVYILPGLVSAFQIIILRTFFQDLPPSLIESAKIDGASEFTIFARIILPLSKPALATIALLTLLDRWNNWFTTLIYITEPALYTLQYLLQKILMDAESLRALIENPPPELDIITLANIVVPTESMRFAMCVLAAGPMLVIFPFFQKYFTKGLTVGAVKG